MDNRSEVREFLASRRAKITPQQAGLPGLQTEHRRVPGLRREPADPGLTLTVYSAEPASPTYDALRLLATSAELEIAQ